MNNEPLKAATSPIVKIGITGGIASGKSYVCHQLEAAGHRVFYCDDEARRIIATDPVVRSELTSLVGPSLYDAEGQLVKPVLADWLCRGNEAAAQVNAIVHPRVAAAFEQCALQMSQDSEVHSEAQPFALLSSLPHEVTIARLCALPIGRVLFMECALLFESGFDRLVDCSVLVHVSEATQIRRLMQRNHISEAKAHEWLALQLTEAERVARADIILPNE